MFQRFTMGAALAGLALAAGASGGAHAEEKAAFTIDVASLYTNLQAGFGPPFAPNADLDGVDGPDATQANIVLFNSVASDVGDPTHDQLHDAWIDNFLLARDTMRDHTALANSVINDIAAVIALFMAIQTHEMEHAMEHLWEDELAISTVAFDSLPWVQAPFFADDHDEDDHHHEGEGHHDDDDHHHDEDDHHHDEDDHHHHHHGGSTIKYYQPIGGNLFVQIPGNVDMSQPIQWYHNGVPMQDYLGLIVGTQSRELELYALEIEQSGAYHVTYTAGEGDDDDHHHDEDDHHHDEDDHHHDEDDHHHDEDDHDHDHKSAKDGDDVFYFIIEVVDPASLPVSNPYLLIALTVLFAVGGAVAFRRLRNA